MFKKTTTWLFFVILVGLFATNYLFDASSLEARWSEQTIPTRTPIPEPTTSGGGNSGGSNTGGGSNSGGTSATNTPIPPTATATATLVPVTLAVTVDSGVIYTPSTCGVVTFESNQGSANVRSGPSQDFRTISQLVFLEVRPVIGRSATAEWWYVELASGSRGWVADIAGNTSGNITTVPIVDETGAIITDTPTWNPTRRPECPTAVPTATQEPPTATPDIPTATPELATATPIPANTTTSEPETETDVTESATAAPSITPAPPTATPEPAPTTIEETAISTNTDDTADTTNTNTTNTDENTAVTSEDPIITTENSEAPSDSNPINWFVVSGIGLIALGAGAYVFQRFRGGTINS